ncbi:MAG: hypothetical protein ABSF64_21735 [Bryobacteraceae bacterium]|jgi:hypothetical protein
MTVEPPQDEVAIPLRSHKPRAPTELALPVVAAGRPPPVVHNAGLSEAGKPDTLGLAVSRFQRNILGA